MTLNSLRIRRMEKITWIVLACLIFAAAAFADGEKGSSAANSAAKGEHQARTGSAPPHQSREAAGEDEQAQFKHSASVQFLAKRTGLSLEQAYWLSVVLNFALIAGAVVWFSRKNLPAMFRSRTAAIQKAMQEARKASEEAGRRLSEIEARLSRMDAEIGEMRAATEKEVAAEEERIKAAAIQDAHKIVESAEQEIAAAAKAARRELTAYAADLAVSLASTQIKVDTATDQALVRGFSKSFAAPDGAEPGHGKDGG